MAVFNKNNTGYKDKEYPLFLGNEMGLFDTINTAYPKLEELYQTQLSQIWNEFEVDLTQDRMDMLQVPPEVTDLMVKTISWQHLADSVACKSIAELFLPYCTNSELEGLLTIQSFFEIIHSRTYSHIVKQTFTDPNKMLEDTYNNTQVLMRSDKIVECFNKLQSIKVTDNIAVKKEAIVNAVVALFGLEGISFMSSFAVTFGISETDVFQGIASLVTLIARDEILHTRMDYEILRILKNSNEWGYIFKENKHMFKSILDSIVKKELDWTEYLFSEGRQVVGLNATLLKEYVCYMAKPLYEFLEVPFDFDVIVDNPLPYMDKYIDSSQIQSAAQEIQLTSYNVGVIEDDTDGLDLDLDF